MTSERSLHPTLLIGLLITTCKNFRDGRASERARINEASDRRFLPILLLLIHFLCEQKNARSDMRHAIVLVEAAVVFTPSCVRGGILSSPAEAAATATATAVSAKRSP